jgi:UPF0755 protein
MALSRGSRWFLATAVLVLAGVAGALWWADQTLFSSDIEAGQPIDYTVERGASVRSVGEDLRELGVISVHPFRFSARAEDAELSARLQPGQFELETGMEVDQVIEVLAAGPLAPPTIRVTIPEGLTVAQTLERLAAAFDAYEVDDFRAVLDEQEVAMEDAAANGDEGDDEGSDEDAGETDEGDEGDAEGEESGDPGPAGGPTGPLALPSWWPVPSSLEGAREPFEGLLWPQTYDIDDEADPTEILQVLVDQLRREVDAIPAEVREAAREAGRDEYQTLILASLVERETRVDDERDQVAGVIAGRLADEMRLQIDATVVYALGEDATQIVTLDQLEIDSPHNTYRIDGLPITPIAGVGTASLRAAFEPADTTARFYVLAPECDGRHVFADTGEEHQENVEAFRAAGRCLEADEDGDLVLDGTDEGIEGAEDGDGG